MAEIAMGCEKLWRKYSAYYFLIDSASFSIIHLNHAYLQFDLRGGFCTIYVIINLFSQYIELSGLWLGNLLIRLY